jgi:hypothetical protein
LAALIPLRSEDTGVHRRSGGLLAVVRKALRIERARGLSGHWSYDRGRHSALLETYRQLKSSGGPPGRG